VAAVFTAGDRIDQPTLDWLFDEGSLTRRLTRLSTITSASRRCSKAGSRCAMTNAGAGHCRRREGWVREVYLRGHGQPWVFARSVAGRSALERGGLDLETLGSRSLGELLFCDQAFIRHPIEVCSYPQAWLPPRPPMRCGAAARASSVAA
jgi:chorismate--pyruvate lyase